MREGGKHYFLEFGKISIFFASVVFLEMKLVPMKRYDFSEFNGARFSSSIRSCLEVKLRDTCHVRGGGGRGVCDANIQYFQKKSACISIDKCSLHDSIMFDFRLYIYLTEIYNLEIRNPCYVLWV